MYLRRLSINLNVINLLPYNALKLCIGSITSVSFKRFAGFKSQRIVIQLSINPKSFVLPLPGFSEKAKTRSVYVNACAHDIRLSRSSL